MTVNNNVPQALQGLIFALVGYAIYSAHDAIVKSLSGYSVFQIIFFAMLFVYVPFSLIRLTDGRKVRYRPIHPFLVFLRALLVVGATASAFMAFLMLPMVEVYVLLFTTPLIISILAIPLLGEKIHAFRWGMIILGLLGVLIVLRPSPASIKIGHLLGLASAFCGAGVAIITRMIGRIESAPTMILSPLLMNITASGLALYFVYKPMSLADLSMMFLMGAMSLAAQLAILEAYRKAPATVVAPMQYSQLLWAVFYGFLFFHETIDVMTVIGAGITACSGILMVWRESYASTVQPIIKTGNIRAPEPEDAEAVTSPAS
ncbi:DMT family transporter [Thiolinea disciformis]|uniref:DMT family transporter n=1 Tax=Thiolinea disciformis TaxID=125614 RepID=UPI00035D80A7|nr:DMT family transporter [Thiolinea disciformis]